MKTANRKTRQRKLAGERWMIVSDYPSGNTYRLWDKNGNYPKQTDIQSMDDRALLMACAPAFLKALQSIAGNSCCTSCQEAKRVAQQALDQLNVS